MSKEEIAAELQLKKEILAFVKEKERIVNATKDVVFAERIQLEDAIFNLDKKLKKENNK